MTDYYLRAARDRYDELRKTIQTVQDVAAREQRDLSDAELRQVKDYGGQAQALYREVEQLQDEQHRSQQVAAKAAEIHTAVNGGGETVNLSTGRREHADQPALYSLLPDAEQLGRLRGAIEQSQGARFTLPRVAPGAQHRAAVTLSLTGGQVAGNSGKLPEPRRLSVAVGLRAEQSTTAGGSGPLFGATTGTAATAEGAVKPEQANVTKLDIAIKALARWTTMSRLGLLSQAGMLEQLVSWHAQAIAKDEDKLIIDALDAAAGAAIAFNTDVTGNIKNQMAAVEDAVAAPADVVLVNPADYKLVASFSAQNADDVASKVVMFGSAIVYPSAAVTAGFALVAALRAAGRFLVADRPSVASTENLSTNETTIRTEELVGFGVRLAGAVKKIDIVTP